MPLVGAARFHFKGISTKFYKPDVFLRAHNNTPMLQGFVRADPLDVVRQCADSQKAHHCVIPGDLSHYASNNNQDVSSAGDDRKILKTTYLPKRPLMMDL